MKKLTYLLLSTLIIISPAINASGRSINFVDTLLKELLPDDVKIEEILDKFDFSQFNRIKYSVAIAQSLKKSTSKSQMISVICSSIMRTYTRIVVDNTASPLSAASHIQELFKKINPPSE